MTHLDLASEFPAATRDQWLKLVDGVLKGADFDKRLVAQTYDGIALQPLQGHVKDASLLGRQNGASPWLLSQRIDISDVAAANTQVLEDLMNGATALTLVFADNAHAHGFGLPTDRGSIAKVLEQVHLDKGVTLLLDVGRESKDAGAIIGELAHAQGLALNQIDVKFGYDPLGDMARFGVGDADWDALAPVFGKMIKVQIEHGFRGGFAAPDGRIVHAAGGSEAQELAFMLAGGVAYLRAMEAASLSLEQAQDALYFRAAVDADQLLSIAKLRALRLLWARVEQACGLTPSPVFIAAETAWRMMTRIDPQVNTLRSSVAAFAGGVGGADAVTVLPLSAAVGLPDAASRRLARNAQVILMEEANLYRVMDPAAGAGAVEAATQDLAAKAWAMFQEIETAGGLFAVLKDGSFANRVSVVRAARLKAISSRKDPLTGASEFPDVHEAPVTVLAPAPAPERADSALLQPMRLSHPFERLRAASDAAAQEAGQRPSVFLANLGKVADFTARTIFAKNFFEAGGLVAPTNDGFTSLEAMIAAYKVSGATIACLCSSDMIYGEQAPVAAAALKSAGARVYLAGRPGELETMLTSAGVEAFAYVGCDVVVVLEDALRKSGVDL